MKEQLELFLVISAALGVLYGVAKMIFNWQLKAKQTTKNEASLGEISNTLNSIKLNVQKVERDGQENITLTKGLLGSVDRMKDTLEKHKIQQVRIIDKLKQHEREIKSLRDTQRIKPLE